MINTGIIILHWHNKTEVEALLRELVSWEVSANELIIVDNSGDYERTDSSRQITVTSGHANLGFAGGCNYGIKTAFEKDCQRILLLNADIALQKSDIVALHQMLDQNKTLAAVAPVLKEIRDGQVTFHKGGQHPLHHSNTRIVSNSGDNNSIAYLPGTVLLMRKEVIDEIGLLDEKYFFSGEIADWFLRLQHTSWTFALHPDVVVEHFNSGNESYRLKHYIYYSLRNRYLFIQKFGGNQEVMLKQKWTNQLRRQLVGALLRFDFSKFMTILHAVRDGVSGRYGKSEKFK
jgi:GT2 family glycosyltransferase